LDIRAAGRIDRGLLISKDPLAGGAVFVAIQRGAGETPANIRPQDRRG
jgi:hypothetical protein